MGRTARGPFYWESSSMSVLHARPRFLLATASAAGIKFCFLVAHAPTSKTGQAESTAWWDAFSALLRRVPERHIPVVMIDANAHFQWSASPPGPHTADNHNARCFADALDATGLVATPTAQPDGTRIVTWVGLQQQQRGIVV